MLARDLPEEKKAEIRAAQTPEEMLRMAQEEGVELTDEQLENVAGGWLDNDKKACGE